jgi:Helix-turn-helix domain
MQSLTAEDPRLRWPTRYDEAEAAEFLGVCPNTLRNWRVLGRGPVWLKYLRRVYYTREALLEWRAVNEIPNG